MSLEKIYKEITESVDQQTTPELSELFLQKNRYHPPVKDQFKTQGKSLSENDQQRLEKELFAEGPLDPLMKDPDVVEIMIMSERQIWYEKKGIFYSCEDHFVTELTFNNFIHRVCDEAGLITNYEHPFANGFWRGFRVHLSTPPITSSYTLTLRRLKQQALTLEDLESHGWCSTAQKQQLISSIHERKNILVIGNTGSGKTTLLNALLAETGQERSIIIEDSSEILQPNTVSLKMLTRFDSQGVLPEITQTDLVKQSLRMRPDRLVLGEIRGPEAKDLLMALSTGHKGSMASLHAQSATEALLRLEMLVQMGAPQWSLSSIRRLIQLCVDEVIFTQKDRGKWHLAGRYKIASLESFGFTVESLDQP